MQRDIFDNEAIKNRLENSLSIILHSLREENIDQHLILYLISIRRHGLTDEVMSSKIYNLHDRVCDAANRLPGRQIDLDQLHEIYSPIIRKISKPTLIGIINILVEISPEALNDCFFETFDSLLYQISKSQGRSGWEYVQPVGLTEFICSLAYPNVSKPKVYNPYAGLVSYGVKLNKDFQYFGQEKNETTWAIGLLRILAYDRGENSFFDLDDSINHWNFKTKFDLIISTPPFGVKKTWGTEDRPYKQVESDLIYTALHSITETGQIIAVLPQSFLFSQQNQSLRKELVEKDILEMVISFPSGVMMNTSIPIIVLVINKTKKDKGVVHLIDAENYIIPGTGKEKNVNGYDLHILITEKKESSSYRIVSNAEISENEYNLSVKRFLIDKTVFQESPEFNYVKIGDLGEIVIGEKAGESISGKFVRIRDLKNDPLDFFLDINTVEVVSIPKYASKIEDTVLLIASRWNTLKPSYFIYSGEPIYISNDIVAIKVDISRIHPAYLISELLSDYVIEQFSKFSTGSIIPFVSKKDLFNIRIKLPALNKANESLSKQLEIINYKAELLNKSRLKENEFNKRISGLENEITEQNRYLRHSLAGPVSNVKGSLSSLKKILNEQIFISYPELKEIKLSDEHQYTFQYYFDILERNVIQIADALSKKLNAQTNINSQIIRNIDIVEFLRNYVDDRKCNLDIGFDIIFGYDEEAFIDEKGELIKTYIGATPELLNDLLNNLLDNAIKHAFNSKDKNRIEVFLMKNTEIEERSEIQILFSNTGLPLPADFSYNLFIKKGAKAGHNAGDGFGGWYINEILKKLGGSFDIIDETGPEGLPDSDLATSFEINIPIIEIKSEDEI